MIAQLLKVYLNGYHNHSGGDRDLVELLDQTTDVEIKDRIAKALSEFTVQLPGYVLVKFNNKMYMCEKNNICHTKPYVKHEVSFHSLQDRFVNI